MRSTFISSTPRRYSDNRFLMLLQAKDGFTERLPPRGSWRGTRLKEYACSIKFNNSMPRKTPSTANAVPLPQEGGLGDIAHKIYIMPSGYAVRILISQTSSLAVGTADHLIRHLTVTPSPTGEGNCKGLFRQQIFNEAIDGRMG